MSRLVRSVVGAAVFAVVVGMALAPATVASAQTNLLPNPTFAGGTTSGWKGTNAALSVVSPGFDSGDSYAAKVSLSNTSTSYAMYAYPKPATNVAQGTQLQGTGQVLGTSGRSICLLLQEYTPGGSLVQAAKQCVTGTGAWQPIGPTNLTVKTSGDSVGFRIRQTGGVAGDSFQADSLELVAASSPPPPPGTVVARWHMDEPFGATTMADSSGNNNNGTLHNVTAGDPGVSGASYRFGGSASKSYVSVPNAASLNPGTADIHISFDLNTTSLPTSGDFDLVRKGTFDSTEYKIELLQSGAITCVFRGTSANRNATGGSGLNNGAWHHIECIKQASQVQLVIDGTVVKTSTGTVGSISNTLAVNIGAYPGSDWYKGNLDELSIAFG
jgi:hypothetical protein